VDIRRRLALNLKRLRAEQGWSQERFAFESGIHRTYVSDLERAARNPSLTMLDKLAKPLGVSASALVAEVNRPGEEALIRP
jgi:transcriptional regulator with XRE-family HTH domain